VRTRPVALRNSFKDMEEYRMNLLRILFFDADVVSNYLGESISLS
jgi:hypothetical protein